MPNEADFLSAFEVKGGIDASNHQYNPPAPQSWADAYHEGWGALDFQDGPYAPLTDKEIPY